MKMNCQISQLQQERKEIMESLLIEIQDLKNNMSETLQPFWQQIKNEMFDLKNYIKEKNEEIRQLTVDYQNQTRNLEKIQNELKTTTNAWHSQSEYITTLSSTFGSLLWTASKEADVVHYILTGNRLSDLLRIIHNSVKTFFDIYKDKFESAKAEEKHFIITFIGIVSNIAAVKEGRQQIIECEQGNKFVNQLIKIYPNIPDNGVLLQKIIIVTWYNISLHPTGLQLIENELHFVEQILQNIITRNKLLEISLKLLESITYDNKNDKFIHFLSNKISSEQNGNALSKEFQDLTETIKNNLEYSTNNLILEV